MDRDGWIGFAVTIGAIAFFGLLAITWIIDDRISDLQRRVECLEQPHGESSLAAVRIDGRWVVTVPRTSGCTP